MLLKLLHWPFVCNRERGENELCASLILGVVRAGSYLLLVRIKVVVLSSDDLRDEAGGG